MFRILNETGRVYGDRSGVALEEPRLVAHVLEQLTEAGFADSDLEAIPLLTDQERYELFGTGQQQSSTSAPTPPPAAEIDEWLSPINLHLDEWSCSSDTTRSMQHYDGSPTIAGSADISAKSPGATVPKIALRHGRSQRASC